MMGFGNDEQHCRRGVHMRAWTVVAGAALMALAVSAGIACNGDSSGGADPEDGADPSEPTPVTETFDPNILSALVLRPEDVPEASRVEATATFNPQRDAGISFATIYRGNGQYTQSTVGYIDEKADRDDGFRRFRESIAAIVGGERNYELPGADLAFAYRGADPATATVLAFKGEYFINVILQATDESRPAEATDQATLDAYTRIVWDRLNQYLQDPASVTPIPDAPKFDASPAAMVTPVPTP
jgi:hypothetical protein